MNKSVQADLHHFMHHLVMALKPIAKAEGVRLELTAPKGAMVAQFLTSTLAGDVAHIINKLVELTPEGEGITVSLDKADPGHCKISIVNTGLNLAVNGEITNSCKSRVSVVPLADSGTRFEIGIDLYEEPVQVEAAPERLNGPNFIPDYYAEIRKRLRSHFTKSESLVETLMRQNPREGVFLKRVNDAIIANMENPQFDTNFLSDIMNMSRTQLFRRLKPVIRQSPGSYVRTIKLQKAKELFETTDLRISEVAAKTGFETASHFTKVFTRQFGVKPSLFCRKKENATNG